ncbi:Aspartic proteinase nepenthesin-1 [Linum perenne]
MVSLSPFSFFFFLILHSTTISSVAVQHSLKLPLLHKPPFSSPLQALSFDSRRLSQLHRRRTSFTSPLVSGASSGSGQYFVSLRLGSPPQPLLLVADTGSDLIWVKCSACRNCSHHSPGSTFLPRHSSTFSLSHCFNRLCRFVPHPYPNPCNLTRLHSPCRYEYQYSDGSETSGFFSRETTTLNTSSGSETKLKNVAFGCGFRVSGPSVTGQSFNGAQGVMGLGRGSISFSSQLGRHFGNNKFSYCLRDFTLAPPPTSYLMIGGGSEGGGSESGAVSMDFTPLIDNPLSPTFYYIGIRSVSVSGVKLPIDPSVWSIDELGNGGMVVDSGTTLTFLPEPAYRVILTAFRRRVKLPIAVDPTPGFDLCVNVSGESMKPSFPSMRLEVEGGSVYAPPAGNYFIETGEGVMCLAIQGVKSGEGFGVIGNLMQQGYLLEFDRDRSRLGFSRHGCALP